LFLKWASDARVSGSSPDTVMYLENSGYFFTALTGLFLICIFFLRTQIDIAIEVVRESCRALLDMKWLAIFPIFPCLLVISYLLLWIWGALYIFSTSSAVKEPAPVAALAYNIPAWTIYNASRAATFVAAGGNNPYVPVNITTYPLTTKLSDYAAWFYLFHMFWVTQFFYYFGYLVFSGAAADWYFTTTDDGGHKKRGEEATELSKFPVCGSTVRSIRYHMGTVAVASFIIAVIKTIRVMVLYIEKQTKGDPPNRLQKALFCLLHCYLKCVECCMDKVNKYALVWTAIYGDNFCIAACSSFALVWRNLFRVAALHTVSSVVFLMGKVKIGLMTGSCICLILMYVEPYKTQLFSPLIPSLVAGTIAYVIAGLFYVVLNGIIDTIFLCFLIDSEVNKKGEMMASKPLQKLVGKYAKDSKKMAKSHQGDRHKRPNDGVDDFHHDIHETEQEMHLVEG